MTGPSGSGDSELVTVGEVFVIEMPSTPTTGYTWTVDPLPEHLELRDSPFRRTPGAQPGDGGVQQFHLLAHRPGTYEVQLVLRRPWESTVAERRTFHVSVR